MTRQVGTITFCRAIQMYGPFPSILADKLGITIGAVTRRVQRNKVVGETYRIEQVKLLDAAEGHIWKAVRDGDLKICQFVLKTLGKSRGYTTGTEFSGLNGSKLVISIGDGLEGKSNDELKKYLQELGQAASDIASEDDL